jgi:ATP-dependent exoDNAse (exonuclease V) alpha subunit
LQEGSGIESSTIHRFLHDYEKGNIKVNENTVIVMDEAGMTGSELMQKVTEITVKHNAKMLLVGDERQLQSVSAGGAFKLIQKQLGGFSELNEVRRQRNEEDKDAANSIAAGQGASALNSYISRGLVHVGETVDSTRESLVKAWAADTHALQEKIIMAQTRNDVFHLNQLARSQLKLAPGNMIKTAIGEREISIGERIMITKNDSKLCVKNGQFATVSDMKFTKSGEVELTIKIDGNKDDIKLQVTGQNAFKHLDHGYAATVHKSQGATVDSAYFYASAFSDKELGYVAMSRHRDQCQVFTPLSKLEDALDRVGIELSEEEKIEDNVQTTLERLGKALEKSHQKTTSLDHITHDEAKKKLMDVDKEAAIKATNEQEVEM